MTLAGYEQKDKNVYTKVEVVSTTQGNVELQRVVLLGKYVMPTETGVIDYLRLVADTVSARKSLLLPAGMSMGGSGLEKAVLDLPEQVHRDLRVGNKELLGFICKNTSALPDGAGALQYVQIQSGLLPPEVIPQIEKEGRSGYESALSHPQIKNMGLGLQWGGKVLLSDGVLPDYIEMDVLLKHVVSTSRTLSVEGKVSATEVTALVQGLYEVEKQDPLFSTLKDISNEMREMYALEPVVALLQMVRQSEMTAALRQQAEGANGSRLVMLGVPGNGAGKPLVGLGNNGRR